MINPDQFHPICQKCRAWKDTTNPFIPSEGLLHPDVLFVGEAPGAEEEIQGKPFVGKSGELFREVLKELELKSYRITNVVRCRPPDNKLRGTELDYCKKFLYQEVLECHPKLIVALGAVALKALTGLAGIMKLRGEVQRFVLSSEGYDPMVLPTIHPAMTLYRSETLEYLVQDFNLIPILLRKADEKPVEEEHIVIDDMDKLVYVTECCQKADRLGVDTETNGLNVYKGARPLMAGVSWAAGKSGLFLFPDQSPYNQEELDSSVLLPSLAKYPAFSEVWNTNQWEERIVAAFTDSIGSLDAALVYRYFKKVLGSPVPKIFQNARFDLEMIEVGLQILVAMFKGDTMIAQFLLDETAKRGLKYMMGRYLQIYNYEAPVQDWFNTYPKLRRYGMKYVPRSILYPYAMRDPDYTRRLSYILDNQLAELEMEALYSNHMIPLVRSCVEMRKAGMKIDEKHLDTLVGEYKKEIGRLSDELNQHPQAQQMLKDKNLERFNVNSTRQVSAFLFDYLNLPRIEGYSTGKHILAELSKTSNEADKILQYRKKNKMYTAFLLPMHDLMGEDGFVRPEVIPDGTRSGRTSCRNPNLQQAPWDSRVRSLYVTRFEKGALYLIDYSQIELRVMAMLSGDVRMMRAYTELDEHGKYKDFHKETAALVYRIPIDQIEDWQRRFIKTVNFGIAYGRGAPSIAAQFDLDVEYCREMIEQWWDQFPQLKEWREDLHKFASKNGHIRTAYKRRRLLPGVFSKESKIVNSSLNAAINSPVQGTAADITSEALNKCVPFIIQNNLRLRAVMLIHDSIIFDVPDEERNYIEEVFVPIMQGIRHPWMRDVPIPVEVKTARSWGEMEAMRMRGEWEGQSDRTLELLGNKEGSL